MPGEFYAIACAFLWALSSTLVQSQTHKMSLVLLGALRTMPAVLIYWGILLFTGKVSELGQLSLRSWVSLAASALVGLVLGDLVYYRSMKLIGLSRAMPLSTTYPFFTMLLALFFLDEQVGWATAGGAVLIAAGGYFLAIPHKAQHAPSTSLAGQTELDQAERKVNLAGVALALTASVCWSVSTVLLRIGLEGVDVVVANAVRLTVLLTVLSALVFKRGGFGKFWNYGFQSLSIVFLTGIVGMGLGTFAYLMAVQRAGAAKTSILSAMTPLFGVPFSLFLRERPSIRTVAGTVLTMFGVWLTI